MRKINNVVTNSREDEEPGCRRGKHSQSPTMESGGLGRIIPHAPVTSQSWGRSSTQVQVRQPTRCTHKMMECRKYSYTDFVCLGLKIQKDNCSHKAISRNSQYSSQIVLVYLADIFCLINIMNSNIKSTGSKCVFIGFCLY